jgi:hypothetical protein
MSSNVSAPGSRTRVVISKNPVSFTAEAQRAQRFAEESHHDLLCASSASSAPLR